MVTKLKEANKQEQHPLIWCTWGKALEYTCILLYTKKGTQASIKQKCGNGQTPQKLSMGMAVCRQDRVDYTSNPMSESFHPTTLFSVISECLKEDEERCRAGVVFVCPILPVYIAIPLSVTVIPLQFRLQLRCLCISLQFGLGHATLCSSTVLIPTTYTTQVLLLSWALVSLSTSNQAHKNTRLLLTTGHRMTE